MENILNKANITDNSSLLMQNDMFSIQVATDDESAQSDMNEKALQDRLSIVNLTNCINTIKSIYNISNDTSLIVTKIDYDSSLNIDIQNKTLVSNSVRYALLNSVTKQKYNISLCSNTNITIKVPIKNTEALNLDLYHNLSYTLDIFNPNSTGFNTRCFYLQDNNTNYDTTVDFRRQNYYQNLTSNCYGSVCNYTQIDENNYVDCQCAAQSQSEINNVFTNLTMAQFWPNFNYDVLLCINLAFKYVNFVFYI